MNYQTQAAAMVKFRRDLKLTQKTLGAVLGYGHGQFISNIERGVAPIPYVMIKELKKLGYDSRKLTTAISKDFHAELKRLTHYAESQN